MERPELPDSDEPAAPTAEELDDESSPHFRPRFLDPERAAKSTYNMQQPDEPPDFHDLDEEEPLPEITSALKPRIREMARLHALGKTNNQICAMLGYSQSRVSILLKTAAVQAEVDRYRNKLYERDVVDAIKDLGGDSVRVLEEVIRDPGEKAALRVDAARWILEKLTGKPKQEVNVESGTLGRFMDVLKSMREAGESLDVVPEGEARGLGTGRRGEASGTPQVIVDVQVKEVGPGGTPPENSKPVSANAADSQFASWVSENL